MEQIRVLQNAGNHPRGALAVTATVEPGVPCSLNRNAGPSGEAASVAAKMIANILSDQPMT
jgi:hypothetical protein